MLEYSDQFGLAGYIVSAILQASGLLTLQNIIYQLGEYLSALGTLFFIVAVITFISKIALGGTFKQAILLLLGPVLALAFLFTTLPVSVSERTTPSTDSKTTATNENPTLESGVLAFFGEANNLKEIQVPLFIIVLNKVSRSVITQITNFILSDKLKDAAVAAARDRLMSRLLIAEHVDSNYRLLLTLSLSGDCAEITSNDWELSREKYTQAPPGSANEAFASQLRAKRAALALKQHRLDQSVIDYLTGLGLTPVATPTCDEIWTYTRDASYTLAQSMLDPNSSFRSEFPDLTDDEWNQTLNFVKEKLSSASSTDTDWNDAYRVLAAFLLRNTLANSAQGALTSALDSHSDWMLPRQAEETSSIGSVESTVSNLTNYVQRFSAAVPYVQGLFFYLLLTSFPFFCILMIFPQRLSALATWASLWIWLLSWEIGFAIVSVVKEILWQSLPSVGDAILDTAGASRLDLIDWNDPASMFSILEIQSPEQHLQTYYGLVALLTLLVPIIMGYCFQAASQLADILSRGLRPGGKG